MDPDHFIIRSPETIAEWNAVKEMLIAYRDEFDADTCFSSFEAEMDHIERVYDGIRAQKLIAVDRISGAIAGCVAYRTFAPATAEMKRLYVVPAYRNRALGRRLAEAIMHLAYAAGYKRMILDTMLRMFHAQKLYRSLGFEEIPPYVGQDPVLVICFEKKLVP